MDLFTSFHKGTRPALPGSLLGVQQATALGHGAYPNIDRTRSFRRGIRLDKTQRDAKLKVCCSAIDVLVVAAL